MIRFLIIIICVFLFLIFSTPWMLAAHIMGKKSQSKKDEFSKKVVQWAFRTVIFLAGVKIILKGRENVPGETAVLYVGNHRSDFDTILTYAQVPAVTGFVAKAGMEKIPLFRIWMRNIKCVFLDRNDLKQGFRTILKGIEQLKAGISMYIFPEGTRSDSNDLLEFHAGSFKLASKSGVPIVPVAISGSREIFEAQFPRIKSGKVIIEYLEPIVIAQLSQEDQIQISDIVRDQIREAYFRNTEELKSYVG